MTIRRIRQWTPEQPGLMLALDEDTPICGARRNGPRSTRCELAPDHLVTEPGEPIKADAPLDPNGFHFHVGRAPSGRYLDWDLECATPDPAETAAPSTSSAPTTSSSTTRCESLAAS